MASARGLRLATATSAAMAMLAGGCTADSVGPKTTTSTALTTDPVAADALVTALRRSLTGTWKVTERFVRTPSGGAKGIEQETRRAQRPPDLLVVGGGTVSAVRNGRQLTCSTGPDGSLTCADAGPAPDPAGEVEAAVSTMRQLVQGSNALYAIQADGDRCFVLRLRVPEYLAPPYGTEGRLCFDPVTGAPTRTEIRRPEGTDVTEATVVSGAVGDADLAPPPG